MKRRLFTFIFIFLFITSLIFISAQPEQEQGDDSFQTDSSGGGESQLGSAWWIEPMSGYRFTIVDSKFNLVKIKGKNSIDIIFGDRPQNSEDKTIIDYFGNSRIAHQNEFGLNLSSEENLEYSWGEILKAMQKQGVNNVTPPYPIQEKSKKIVGNGEEFKTWMMEKFGIYSRTDILINTFSRNPINGGRKYYFNIEGFDKWREEKLKTAKDEEEKKALSEQLRPNDYMNEMGYNLVIEPIVWFEPVESGKEKFYGKYVYGTVSNFVEWFLDPEHEVFGQRYKELVDTRNKSENHGGAYSNLVSRVGKSSMTVNEDVYEKLPDGTKGELLIKSVDRKNAPLHNDGKVNIMSDIKKAITGKAGEEAPYGYAMQFYYLSQKPTPPPKIIPKPTPQPDHKYGLTGHIVVSSDEFDVSKEQPVDENVKISAFVDDPIVLDYTFKQVDYTNTYHVTFVQPYSDGHSVSKKEQYVKNGTYYEIDHLSCFRIKHVDVFSKSLLDMDYLHLPIRLGEEHLTKALDTIDIYQNQNHIFFDANSYAPNSTNSLTITLPTKSVIKTKVKVKNKKGVEEEKVEISYPPMSYSEPASEVCNDHIQIGSQIMMAGKEKTGGTSAPAPTEFKGSGQSEFRLHPYKIPIKIPNANNPTTGDLLYELVVDIDATLKELKPDKIKGNDVHIFTPVGVSFKMNERPEFDQRHDEDELRKKGVPAFPINRVLRFDIDTKRPDFAVKENQKGMHYKRPDGRDTVRFMDHIAIVCGFDAYVSTKESDINEIKTDKKFYYEADDTIKLDKNTKTIYIKPANWAKELENSLSVYSVAKNYIAYKKPYQSNLYENIEDSQVAAKKRIDVDIVGRLFDLRVHHVDDPNWIENYQKQDAFFVTGLGGLNGQERERAHAYILQLPVRNGKNLNKGHQKLFPRLGYKVEFSVRTMGDFYFSNQLIGITPKYYVIDEDTDQRVEVDLYYKSKGGYERYQDSENPILIGKNQLRHKYSAARKEDMQETLKIYESGYLPHKEGFNQLSAREFVQNINIPINCNYPDILQLRSLNRVFVGDRFAYYPSKDIRKKHLYRASAQQWYGRFYLPSSIVAVRKDTDLREAYRKKEKFFIDKGYLIVNFDVNVYSGGEKYNEKAPRLSYRTSTSNTWENEGYQNRFRDDEIWDFQLKYGDVLIFDLSKRATDRLKVGR